MSGIKNAAIAEQQLPAGLIEAIEANNKQMQTLLAIFADRFGVAVPSPAATAAPITMPVAQLAQTAPPANAIAGSPDPTTTCQLDPATGKFVPIGTATPQTLVISPATAQPAPAETQKRQPHPIEKAADSRLQEQGIKHRRMPRYRKADHKIGLCTTDTKHWTPQSFGQALANAFLVDVTVAQRTSAPKGDKPGHAYLEAWWSADSIAPKA